jgi:hypothetical protein
MVFPGYSCLPPSPTSYLESDSPYHPHNMADVAKLNKTLLLPQKGRQHAQYGILKFFGIFNDLNTVKKGKFVWKRSCVKSPMTNGILKY